MLARAAACFDIRYIMSSASCFSIEAEMAQALFGDNARAVVTVPASIADSELEWLWRSAVQGLRYHQMRGSVMEWSDVQVMAERIRGTDWHVQLQFDGPEFPDHEGLIAHLPCTVVIDHMGRHARPRPLETVLVALHPAWRIGEECRIKSAALERPCEALPTLERPHALHAVVLRAQIQQRARAARRRRSRAACAIRR
jgi:hypothetical protein